MKKLVLGLCLLALVAGSAFAQAPVPDPGWTVFAIHDANDGVTGPPIMQDNDVYATDAIEIAIVASGQKAGLATDQMNGAKVSGITALHIDRLDDVAASGSLYGPYFNIWVTDGLGHYAVLANEPSDAEWAGSRWDVPDWNFLMTKRCKVYETTGSSGGEPGTSWVATYTGKASGLVFADVADLIIAPPPPAYIADPANGVGSGAPDEQVTNIAHGYTWVFGDSAANYISGGDGFIVDNYLAEATFAVQNTTQGTSYTTIEAALAAANPFDVITIDDGIYNPVGTLTVNQAITLTGVSENGVVINIPTAGGYGISVAAADVTLQNFTLVANTSNENYPIHASGTSNPPNGFNNLTLENITIQGTHRRTGFDIHGFNTLVMSHLTSKDATGGNGAQITGCVDVTVDNITALNNNWGSFAIYASDVGYLGRPSSNVLVDGATMNFDGAFFSQDEFGFFNNNITVTGWDYEVTNTHFREALGYTDSEGYTFFAADQATALAIATSFVGYEQYSAMLNTTAGNYEVVPGLTIKAAIEAAGSGDTVNVASGTYVESGQIVIDKDLSIIGDSLNRPVVMTDSNTGSSGDTRGWFLQTSGTTVSLSYLELDGAGFDIYQGIRATGDGLLDHCALRNIVYPGYGGVAVAAFGATYWNVTNCTFDNIGRVGVLNWTGGTFSGNTYTGKGPGDWLDYAVDTNAGAAMVIEGNTVTACQGVALSDGSTSAGLLVSTFYGAGTTATINNNVLNGNSDGIAVGYDGADSSVVSGSGNDLSQNDSYGVSNSSLVNSVDFTGNWWGSATGPFHATLNPAGTGVPVGDNILFNPWSGMAAGDIVPVTTGPLNCSQTVTLTFSFTADTYTPDVFLYNAVVSATPGLDFGSILDLEPFGTVNNNFYALSTGPNQWTITGSTVGNPTSPITGAGTKDLFTITFSATGDVVGNVNFDSLTLRDPDNNTIPVALTGAEITYDCTAPAAVTGVSAAPGHNKVDVAWIHDGSDVDHYEVYRGLWYDTAVGTSAYPEYDDVGAITPTRPSAYGVFPGPANEWVPVDGGTVTTTSFTDDSVAFPAGRGVYYYEVFAVDAAGNGSAPAAANDRATNYWLGDVDGTPPGSFIPNGTVGVEDINALGTAFGSSEAGGGNYNNIIDVGPTDDWSRLGIPTTDNLINFEDLMIFSLNFGVVSSAKTKAPLKTTAGLAWVTYDDGTQALRLVDGTGLKGLRVRADVPVGSVEAGQLLDDQSELTFLKNVGDNLDASVAVMGMNQAFEGSGDLLLVRAGSPIEVKDLRITARGTDNSELQFTMDTASGTLTPRVFALNANYPNPFNPMTKISFSLPEAQDVKLAVYSIDGRRVATLVNETRGPGLHEVVWTGRDDQGQTVSSGLYFYRLDAGPYSQVRKMTLMK